MPRLVGYGPFSRAFDQLSRAGNENDNRALQDLQTSNATALTAIHEFEASAKRSTDATRALVASLQGKVDEMTSQIEAARATALEAKNEAASAQSAAIAAQTTATTAQTSATTAQKASTASRKLLEACGKAARDAPDHTAFLEELYKIMQGRNASA